MSAQNLTLLTDLYELTMMQGYFETQENQTVVFDVFFRDNPNKGGYSVMAGLDQVIDYIKNLNFSYEDVDYLRGLGLFSEDFLHYLSGFHFSGDIYAIPEGSVIFPREPLLKVVAPIMEAQLVETAILTILNHQCLIATKASRVVYAAQGDGIMEFGLRRAQGPDAGLYGARAAVIGGCVGTSNVLAGEMFDVPIMGTHAHSRIMTFKDEYTAFKEYARLYPDACTLLVDTYDTLKSGVPNAIRVFTEMRDAGIKPKSYGIRLDSGDLAYLSKKARKMLDDAGFQDAVIAASTISRCRALQFLPGASERTLLHQKTARPLAVFINWLLFKTQMENSSRRSRFLRILRRSPIREIKPFIVFTIKKPVCCALISSALLMRHLIQGKIFFSLTQMLHGRKHFFRVEPTQCVNCLSQSSNMENVSMSPHL